MITIYLTIIKILVWLLLPLTTPAPVWKGNRKWDHNHSRVNAVWWNSEWDHIHCRLNWKICQSWHFQHLHNVPSLTWWSTSEWKWPVKVHITWEHGLLDGFICVWMCACVHACMYMDGWCGEPAGVPVYIHAWVAEWLSRYALGLTMPELWVQTQRWQETSFSFKIFFPHKSTQLWWVLEFWMLHFQGTLHVNKLRIQVELQVSTIV